MASIGKGVASIFAVACIKRTSAIGIRFSSTFIVSGKQAPEEYSVPSWKAVSFDDASKERAVEIATCGQLFEKWRRENRFWSVPKSDVNFTVKYIDTGHDGCEESMPTVLSLHGSPGTYKEFAPMISHLYSQGVRVIAPNFPGATFPEKLHVKLKAKFDEIGRNNQRNEDLPRRPEKCSGTEKHPKVFRHTPEEKSQYISDFLQALRVPRVDLVLCHSSALFPGLHLIMENRGIAVNSLCLLNPTGLDIPRLLNPVWLTYCLVRICEFPMGYKITCLIGEKLAKKPELKGGSFQEHLLSAITLLNSDIPKQTTPFQTLLSQNFPVLLAFSENDKLIDKKTSHKMAKMMVDDEDVYTYDKKGKLDHAGGINPFRKVMAFQNGSHFLLRTYPDSICNAVSTFLFQQFNNRADVK